MKIAELFNVSGKVAIVTGGSRGIGEMIAAGFLANGVKVYITARKEAALIEKAHELSKTYAGECIPVPCDLSTMDGMNDFEVESHQITNTLNDEKFDLESTLPYKDFLKG